jgi:bifunctional UDP-N-acetylglucosamine pyrophosphorylase/glucosamine-1-phosphate N-acetyltransferase
MGKRFAVILAAGKGTRMKSPRAKVLHEVGNRTMLAWSAALAKELGCERTVIVVGPDAPEVSAAAAKLVGAENVAVQREQKGTANAVDAARAQLAGEDGQVIVLYADTPLVPKDACERAFDEVQAGSAVCVLGFEASEPGRYGRLVTAGDGALEAIVEAADASREELEIAFCNSGVMAAHVGLMFELLAEVRNDNAKGEFYLTDIVTLARGRKLRCAAARCEENDVLGVNSQAELAVAERVFQDAVRKRMMDAGVTLVAPETVFFSHDTQIAPGVTIEPNVVFMPGVSVGPGALIHSFCHFANARVEAEAELGPYARLRPGAVIGKGAHIGNFVEVKNTTIGEGAKANHLSYLGDGEVGAGANIGAGTIFCNYDGFFKYKTVIGAGAFIGSNTALVAPVTVGDRANVGAGAVLTEDVAPDALALGRAMQVQKAGWAKTFREKQSAAKKAGTKPKGAI